MGRVAVSKGAHSTVHRLVRHRFGAGLPRWDATEVPVGRDAVPKTRQKNALPREDATEVLVGKVAVPKCAHSTVHRPVRHRFGAGLPRGDGSGIPVSKVAMPKGALVELIEL